MADYNVKEIAFGGNNYKLYPANLTSETLLNNAAQDATETQDRVYPVRMDANGKLAVNVPWTDSGGSGPTADIAKLKSDLGIVEDTDVATHAIAKGQYVIWHGELYKASSEISVDDVLSVSNLTAVSGGVGNDLNNNFKWTCLLASTTISNEGTKALSDSIENYNEIYVQMHVYVSSGTYKRGCSAVIPVDAIKEYGYSSKNQFIISAIGSVNADSSKLNYAEYAQISFTNATTLMVNYREARGWSGSYYFTVYAR